MTYTFTQPAVPTAVGQRVRFLCYGGPVRQYHVGLTGKVDRFTPAGSPVIRLDEPTSHNPKLTTIYDRYECARRVDEDGSWILEEVTCAQS